MKNLLKAFATSFIIIFTFIMCCGISVFANEEIVYDFLEPTPFTGLEVKDGKVISEYSFVWRETVVDTDFIVDKTKHLIIKPIGDSQTDARVTVNNGAVANIKGDLFIERGGTLEIKDGTVIINGGNITNCGTIKIGKKALLKF